MHFPHDSEVWFASTPDALTHALLKAQCSEENADAWLVPMLTDWRRVPPNTRRAMTSCSHVLSCAAALSPAAIQRVCSAACRYGAANFVRAVNETHVDSMRVHTRRGVFTCAFAASQCETADGFRAFVYTCASSPKCHTHSAVVCRFAAVLAYQWGGSYPRATCSALMAVCCTPHFIAAGLPCMNALVLLLQQNPTLHSRVCRLLRKHQHAQHKTMASAVNTRVLHDVLLNGGKPSSQPLPAGWSDVEHSTAIAAASV